MKHLGVVLAFWGFASMSLAQSRQDIAAIKSMCGCHEVSFEFGETFSPDKGYQFYQNYQSSGLEWVELVEDSKGKIVLQHLLIVTDSTGAPSIVKHWRQDWLYEHTVLYSFDRENRWKYVQLRPEEVKGRWVQKVYQVDDGPRYEGLATWVHVDGRHYWESTADSPLPRREFTKRSDYNVLRRRNRHEITSWGWLHEQDNDKVLRSEAGDQLIAREKGWDTYRRVEDSRCQAARQWWQQHQGFWAAVRQEWQRWYDRRQDLELHKTVEDKPLFMHFYKLPPDRTHDIRPLIQKFVRP